MFDIPTISNKLKLVKYTDKPLIVFTQKDIDREY